MFSFTFFLSVLFIYLLITNIYCIHIYILPCFGTIIYYFASLVAKREATLVAKGQATLVGKGEATLVAKGKATLVAKGEASLVAKGEATLVAKGKATLVARGEGLILSLKGRSLSQSLKLGEPYFLTPNFLNHLFLYAFKLMLNTISVLF